MQLLLRLLKLLFRRLHFIVIGIVVFAITAMISLYFINPYNIKSNNIRPRIIGMDIYRIPSKSMQPLLNPGDVIVISNKAYLETAINRNEIIVFNRKPNEKTGKVIPFIKRVVALPGDLLKIHKGFTYVNGKQISESYIKSANKIKQYSLNMTEIQIPKDKLFVLGDNRDNSNDSRMFGVISKSDVVGKATAIIYSANGKSGGEIK